MCRRCQPPPSSSTLAPVIRDKSDVLSRIRGRECDISSLRPSSPATSDDGGIGSDIASSTPSTPSTGKKSGRRSPMVRRRSQGDDDAAEEEANTMKWLEEARRTRFGGRPGKRRRAEKVERGEETQAKITSFFSRNVKHVSAQLFPVTKVDEDVCEVQSIAIQTDDVEEDDEDESIGSPEPGEDEPEVSLFARPEGTKSLRRAPSEASSVDSGLGSLSTPGTPSTSSETLSTPGTPGTPADVTADTSCDATPVLRFPARPDASSSLTCCKWLGCGYRLSSTSKLLDHLQERHIEPQKKASDGGRRCLWQGCKVFDKSGSAAWLERHVLSHGGSKPHRCIVDGCHQRFSSQSVLQRHVNSHFAPAPAAKRLETFSKLASKRNNRRAAQEQHPFSARIIDFCDADVMERIRYQLVTSHGALSRLGTIEGRSVQLTAQVTARRVRSDGTAELLVRWTPPDLREDEWVLERQFRPTCHVPCSQLPAHVASHVASAVGQPPARHRRKP